MNPNDIFTAYFNLGQQYAGVMEPYAMHLVWLLAFIELVTIGVTYIMGSDDAGQDLLWRIVRLAFTGGFAWWWVTQSWALALEVVGSFNQLGQTLTGLANLTPMHFLQTGYDLVEVILTAPASDRLIPNLGAAVEQIVLCFAIFIMFALIAALVVVTLISFYLIVGPGSILISFMPCRFTSAMAENYFTWLVRLGVIVMMFYVVLGTAQTFAVQYSKTLIAACHPVLSTGPLAMLGAVPIDTHLTVCSNPIPTGMLLQIAADMTILMFICVGIPFIAGSLVNHGVNMTLEHLASAKYLGGSVLRNLASAIGGLTHVVQRMVHNSSQQTTLQQRMVAGAAAARASSGAATTPLTPPPSPPPSSPGGGWNGRPAGPPLAPPPNGSSGSGGAALEYYPGRPGAQTRAEAIDITKLQKR